MKCSILARIRGLGAGKRDIILTVFQLPYLFLQALYPAGASA